MDVGDGQQANNSLLQEFQTITRVSRQIHITILKLDAESEKLGLVNHKCSKWRFERKLRWLLTVDGTKLEKTFQKHIQLYRL
jgi:hypothetical protein